MQNKEKAKWDKKTQTFPRFDLNNNEFQDSVVKILEENKYINKNYSILDIGCGTGIFTITLAKKVKEALGIDLSNKMLKILNEDAYTNNIKNISTLVNSLDEFETKEKYDLVFASRTPALEKEKDYIKMTSLSKKFIAYLGFAGYKESNIQREITKKYPFKFKEFNEIKDIKAWLGKSSKEYKSYIFEQKFSRSINEELALKYIDEYLNTMKKTLSKKELEDILSSIKKDKEFIYELDTKLELLLWQN